MPIIYRADREQRDRPYRVPLVSQPVGDGATDCGWQIADHRVAPRERHQRSLEIGDRDRTEQRHGQPVIDRFHVAGMRERAVHCKRRIGFVAAAALSVMSAACEAPPPSGQVVANVDRDVVTMRELSQQRQGQPTAIGAQAALDQIVIRKILASEARARGLEQDGDYHFALRAMQEGLLVDALQRDLARTLPPVTDQQVAARMMQQPWRYGQRFRLDLVPAGTPGDSARASLDSGSFAGRPPADILTATAGSGITLGDQGWRVVRRTPIAVDREALRRQARDQLRQERSTDVMRRIVANYRQTGKIRYQQGFGPSGR